MAALVAPDWQAPLCGAYTCPTLVRTSTVQGLGRSDQLAVGPRDQLAGSLVIA
jgi:hypothetical protein